MIIQSNWSLCAFVGVEETDAPEVMARTAPAEEQLDMALRKLDACHRRAPNEGSYVKMYLEVMHYIYVHMYNIYIYIYSHICMYETCNVCKYYNVISVCNVYLCMYACMHVCVCIYIYRYVYMRTFSTFLILGAVISANFHILLPTLAPKSVRHRPGISPLASIRVLGVRSGQAADATAPEVRRA